MVFVVFANSLFIILKVILEQLQNKLSEEQTRRQRCEERLKSLKDFADRAKVFENYLQILFICFTEKLFE